MLEYPTPLRGMASSLTTNIRLSVTQRRRPYIACLGSTYFNYQQKFLEEGYFRRIHVKEMEISAIFHAYVENTKALNVDGQSECE